MTLLLSSGCGYIGAVVAAVVVASDDGGSEPPPQIAPEVALDPILRQDGDIRIDYTLLDENSSLVDILLEVSPDGGSSWVSPTESTAPASEGVVQLTSDPAGISHVFVWDSVAEIGILANTAVQVRITPTDETGLVGSPALSGNVTVGNDVPTVQFPIPVPDSINLVALSFDILDSTQDPCDVERSSQGQWVEWSTDGGSTFSTATITVGDTVDLASTPGGIRHVIAWDSATDIGPGNYTQVVLQLAASDDATGSVETGPWVQTNTFQVLNNDLPAAFIAGVPRQDDIVQVDFYLQDPQGDLMSVLFEYSPDMGASFLPMTLTPASVTTNLPPTAPGSPHSVDWDSTANIGLTAATVRLRVTPTDMGGTGPSFETPDFIVGNDTPSVSVTSMFGEVHDEGIITVEFTLADSTSDPVDVSVGYSTDGGANFWPATIEVGSVTNLTPGPTVHRLSWNSLTDFGNGSWFGVNVQVIPCDDEIGTVECGTPGFTQAFDVLNVDRPRAFIASPIDSQVTRGDIDVSYLLYDNASQVLGITIDCSTNGGLTWNVATDAGAAAGSEGTVGLSSLPGGDRHDFVWDSLADLTPPVLDFSSVKLRLTPNDGSPGIVHIMAGTFLVNNNREPVAIVGTPPSPQTLGNVVVSYSLEDPEADTVNIFAEFSTSAGFTWSTATDAGAGAGSEGLSGLSSGPSPVPHTFVWNSIFDLVALNLREDDVVFRIIPSDNPSPMLGEGPVSRTILFSIDNTTPPSVSISPVAAQSGDCQIDYTLFDDESAPSDLLVEYDGGSGFLAATEGPGSDGVTGLASTPGGTVHLFVWDSATDIGPARVTGVRVRLTPSDTKTGLAALSNPFDVDNNAAPTATIQTPGGLPSGDIVISYNLSDSNSDLASILPEFSTNGGVTFAPATERPGLPSEGLAGLITSPAGVNHVFVWDSAAVWDIGIGFAPAVIFRIQPRDTLVGVPASTLPFPVNNQNLLPVVRIDPVGRSVFGNVTITYLIADGDSDPANITVEWRQGVGPFVPATQGPGGDPVSNLATSSSGTPHTFVWNAAADLFPPGAWTDLEIRISPADNDGSGFGDISNPFTVGNDAPTVTITSPLGGSQTGLVEFTFTLSDSTADTVDIDPEYSLNGGATFDPAAIAVGGLANLYAPPLGASHDIAWNSIADVGPVDLTGVVFRITPTDSLLALGAADTVTIDIANNDLPVSYIGSPAGNDLVSGNVPVSHLLIDGNSDTVTVTVEFSTDGWVTSGNATLANTDEGVIALNQISGLSSSPDGVGHSFDWLSGTDVGTNDTAMASLRITPDDGTNTGAPYETADFLVNNNAEPVATISTPAGPQVGDATIDYVLSDPESDPVDIDVLYSLDGVSFFAATEGLGSDGTAGLAATPGGTPHIFVWDTVADGVGTTASENGVVFRIVPRDNPNLSLGQGVRGQTDTFTVDNTQAPSVVIGPVPDPTSADVVIDYDLVDVESDLQGVLIEYSTDAGTSFQTATECTAACTPALPASEGSAGLASSPGGTAHVFRWASSTDLGPASLLVGIRITPTDTKTGTPALSNVFLVDNNDAPVASVATPPGAPSGDVVISYTLSDTNGDDASITPEYSLDGGTTFLAATEQAGLPSEGAINLLTSPSGINHIFVWDSTTDIGVGLFLTVVFRITPADTDTGLSADSGVFPVSNQAIIPGVAIDPVPRSFTDDVTITYRLFDGDSDPVNILVEWQQNLGGWSLATEGVGSDGIVGLAATPSGTAHTFVWDSAADLLFPGAAFSGLEIRITPTDADGTGAADISNLFVRGNDAPSLTITAPLGGSQSGLVEFTYDLADSTSDLVSLAAEYSLDAGVTYNPAAISVGELVDVPSSPAPGTTHTLGWNSIGDLGIVNLTGVIFRLTPNDTAPGSSDQVTIDIDNNDLPIVVVGSPAAGDLVSGDVAVSHLLIDGNFDTITVTVEFSTDGWVTFGNATLANTDEGVIALNQISGLSSSPDGVGHSFDWLSGTDVGTNDAATVSLRITPDDGTNTGLPYETADFLVNNNAEPTATISTPAGPEVGDVTIDYVLSDPESDPVDIDALYSLDGVSFFPATEGVGSDGTVGLAATPGGTAHIFVWDTVTDGVGAAAAENAVIFRIVPRDNPILALGEGTRAQTDTFTVDNTSAPSVVITPVADPSSGDVSVNYVLVDVESDLASITVEYDAGSGYLPATEGLGSDGTTGLASSPGGTAHVFVWESATDLGPALVSAVTLRITPTDTKTGASAVSNAFDVDNNDAPVATVATPPGAPSDDVVISYSLADTNSDTASIAAWYSIDSGVTFAPATEQTGLPSEGVINLVTNPAGINHIFVWDSITDIGVGLFPNVVFQVIPSDIEPGIPADSGLFPVNNSAAVIIPGVAIDFVPRSFTDDVTITYRLFDGDSDPVDIVVEWQQNSGGWNPATMGVGGDGISGLAATPSGTAHTYVWDSGFDLGSPGAAFSGLEVRITPSDGDGTGTADVSNVFVRGNDGPSLTITSPVGGNQSGLIEFTYDLVDSTSDLVDLVAEYSTDSGLTFNIAAIPVGELVDVVSSPSPGTTHTLAWNSIADLGAVNVTGVIFRLTPSDTDPGTSDEVIINVSNNDLPISHIGSPGTGDLRSADVRVDHILIDVNSDPITVTVDYSTDGGATFASPTLANSDEGVIAGNQISGLSSSPDGVGHNFDWLSLTNIGANDTAQARLRITPDDGTNIGAPYLTPNFLVNNNVEPTATISTPVGPEVGDVTIDYVLSDPESDATDIDVLYSLDGVSFFTAAEGLGSDGTTGLAATPGGTAHIFVWDSVTDGVGVAAAENGVIFRIVPRDNPILALGEGTRAQTDTFTVDNTSAPSVVITPVADPSSGDVSVNYVLVDVESDLASITVEYDAGSGYLPATEGVGSDGTTGLVSSPVGTAHVFVWESATDLGPALVSAVTIRITPTDTKTGASVVSNAFDVDNNDAPTASVTTPAGAPSDDVVIPYALTDTNGDTASMAAWYSTDSGTTFSLATEQPGLPSEGTSGLVTSPTGINHIFVWDSLTDVGVGLFPNVVFRVVPSDTDTGLPADSGVFPVNNSGSVIVPGVAIDFVPRSFPDAVTITYRLFDGDSDPVDILVQWQQNSGGWNLATEGLGSDGTSGLSATPSGTAHTYVWDSAADLGSPGAAMSGLEIRITPSDGDGTGTADVSNVFIRGNDAPSLTITSPLGGSWSGLVEFTYDLVDSTSDPVDLAAEYSVDGGVTYNPAAITVGELLDVASSPAPGTTHTLGWNSIADLGAVNLSAVIFRLTPSDPAAGISDLVTIDIDNNGLPVAHIGCPSPGEVVSGNVRVCYTLIDAESDAITITVDYSTDGGSTFTTATLANTDEGVIAGNQISGLSSSPDGVDHFFDWVSGTDLAALDTDQAQIRITPEDSLGSGPSATSPIFLVDNNDEPRVQSIDGFPPGDRAGNVTLSYALEDVESDATTITVSYSTDGGVTFSAATLANTDEGLISGNEITGLSTSPAGVSHFFDWVSDSDLPGALETNVVLRLEPRDHSNLTLGLGLPGRTMTFTLDNTQPPEVNNLANVGGSGTIQMTYDLFDQEPAPSVDIEVTYSLNGIDFFPATILSPTPDGVVSGNTIQGQVPSNTPPGAPKSIDWDTVADLGATNVSGVTFRMVPMDTKIGPAAQIVFDILNNDAPIAAISDITGIQSGDVSVNYTLEDSNSDPVDIVVEYSLGGGPRVAATEGPGSDGITGLTSAPGGIGHLFVWDSLADIGTGKRTDAEIHITPSDPIVTGGTATSNVFTVDNSIPADLVLGHPSFVEGGIDGRGIDLAGGGGGGGSGAIDFDGTNLYLCDPSNHRALIFGGVPVSDFETADQVLGQKDLTVAEPDYLGLSASGLNDPSGGIHSDGTSLYLCDTDNHRVLVWDTLPVGNRVPADHVLGQPDFTSNLANRGGATAADTLSSPQGVYSNGGGTPRLFVSDTGNHRVLVWDLPITYVTEGPAADHVLGQGDFTSNTADRGTGVNDDTLDDPRGVFADGTTLFVADRNNNRVLQWNQPISFPSEGPGADRAIGQPDLVSEAENSDPGISACTPDPQNFGLSRRTLFNPTGIFADSNNTYVADTNNHRVLIWNSTAPATDSCADVVLGQSWGIFFRDPNSGGLSDTSLFSPTAVVSTDTDNRLLICDQENNRLKIHDPIPTTTNAAARVVCGQETFFPPHALPNHGEVTARSFRVAAGLETDGNVLFLADHDNNRVLGWSSLPTVSNKNADLVFGQLDFVSFDAGTSAVTLSGPSDVAYDPAGNGRLMVADRANNRIVVYDGPFSVGQTGAQYVGQVSPAGNTAGTAPNRLSSPAGVSWDGAYLWVADEQNHRVLRFPSANIVTDGNADLVLGQVDFAGGTPNHGGGDPEGDNSLDTPVDVVSTGGELVVADQANHRALIWSPLPGANDTAASVVVGQASFTLGGGAGGGQAGLNLPTGVDSDGTILCVTDGGNHRLLIWDSIPLSNGVDADRFLGQTDFNAVIPNNGGVTARSLYQGAFRNASPSLVGGASTLLWLPDQRNNRVLRLDVTP